MAWPLLAVVALVALGLGYLLSSESDSPGSSSPLRKLPIHLDGITEVTRVSISPTANYIAFAGKDTLNRSGLFLFEVATGLISYIEGGGEVSRAPIFSPDGSRLAYFDTYFYLVTVPAGVPTRVLSSVAYPLAWEDAESVLFYSYDDNGTMRIDLPSRVVSPMAVPDTTEKEGITYRITGIIPESKLGIGTVLRTAGVLGDDPAYVVVDLESGRRRILEDGVYFPKYVPGGHVVYQLGGGNVGPYLVRPIDPRTGEFTGPPEPLLPEIPFLGDPVGAEGSFLYVPELLDTGADLNRLHLFDLAERTAEELNIRNLDDVGLTQPAYSPDGRFIAFVTVIRGGASQYVAEYDMLSEVVTRRTFGDPRRDPDWSADGASLFFSAYLVGNRGINRISNDVAGEEQPVVTGDAFYPDVSPDGDFLAYSRSQGIYLFDLLEGTETVVDSSVVQQQGGPEFSPDGRYLAYQNASDGKSEIDIRTVSGSGYRQLGFAGAAHPKWAPDGRSLFFSVAGDGIYRVPVTLAPAFNVLGEPEKIVDVRSRSRDITFDVGPEGKRLVISGTEVGIDLRSTQKQYSTIMWWQNWAQSLGKD